MLNLQSSKIIFRNMFLKMNLKIIFQNKTSGIFSKNYCQNGNNYAFESKQIKNESYAVLKKMADSNSIIFQWLNGNRHFNKYGSRNRFYFEKNYYPFNTSSFQTFKIYLWSEFNQKPSVSKPHKIVKSELNLHPKLKYLKQNFRNAILT